VVTDRSSERDDVSSALNRANRDLSLSSSSSSTPAVCFAVSNSLQTTDTNKYDYLSVERIPSSFQRDGKDGEGEGEEDVEGEKVEGFV
jgi:hypothetical protein